MKFLFVLVAFLSLTQMSFIGFARAKEKFFESKLDLEAKKRAISNRIIPFSTDGCSRFPDGIGSHAPYLICCELHDIIYWVGHGDEQSRLSADNELSQCVAQHLGTRFELFNKIFGKIVGNGPQIATPLNTGNQLPTTYRWGYGWGGVIGGYTILNEKQRQSVIENLHTIVPAIEKRRAEEEFPKLTDEDRKLINIQIWRLFESFGYTDQE